MAAKPILTIDNTWASAFRACKRKGFYRHVRNLTRDTVASELSFGAAVHQAIAAITCGVPVETAIAFALTKIKQQEEREREWRTPEKLVEVIEKFSKAEFLHLPVLTIAGKPAVEMDFSVPLLTEADRSSTTFANLLEFAGYDKEAGVQFVGVVDAMVDFGGTYARDFKTTSEIFIDPEGNPAVKPAFFRRWQVNPQIPGYVWGVGKALGRPITGGLITAIGANKSNCCFAQEAYTFSPGELEEWRQDLLHLVKEYLECVIAGYFPRDGNACYEFFRFCPYFAACSAPTGMRPTVEGAFTTSPWEPLKERDKEGLLKLIEEQTKPQTT